MHLRGHSNTGHVGITRSSSKRGKRRRYFFTVSVRPKKNKVVNRKFYFPDLNHLAEDIALSRAIEWRAQMWIVRRSHE